MTRIVYDRTGRPVEAPDYSTPGELKQASARIAASTKAIEDAQAAQNAELRSLDGLTAELDFFDLHHADIQARRVSLGAGTTRQAEELDAQLAAVEKAMTAKADERAASKSRITAAANAQAKAAAELTDAQLVLTNAAPTTY